MERPSEKIKGDARRLSNAELLLLISGGKDFASAYQIIGEADGLAKLGIMSYQEIVSLEGVTASMAAKIVAAFEIGKRYSTTSRRNTVRCPDPEAISDIFMDRFKNEQNEHMAVVFMNAKLHMIKEEIVFSGGVNNATVDVRVLFSKALKYGAASIILVHNHPSGDPAPSEEDIQITKTVKEAGALLQIKLVDHIVIGDGMYVSLLEKKLL
jgi:DNA repair protein RadC